MKGKRVGVAIALAIMAIGTVYGQNITIYAVSRPAEKIFAEIMRQSGKNFVYTSDLLKGLTLSVDAKDKPLKDVLNSMFSTTDISFKIRGNNVMLFRKKKPAVGRLSIRRPKPSLIPDTATLNEVIVHGSKNQSLTMESPSVGALTLSRELIASTPVIFGESDVVKTLQYEPGISAGVEGMAGMYVHGGNADENLYLLDKVPLYQVNHLGGLLSAFNTEAIRGVDFYKSTFPARYDGRLSSYMEVNTKEGSMTEHHGSVRLGLTSSAFNVDGPIRKGHTSYVVALRRSWYDLLSIPALAIANKVLNNRHPLSAGYAFTDLNAKVSHRFSKRSDAYLSFYYGNDYLKTDVKDCRYDLVDELSRKKNNLNWGNIVASAGWNYKISPSLFSSTTGAFSRFSSKLTYLKEIKGYETKEKNATLRDYVVSDNYINDWLIRSDFNWQPNERHNIGFGGSFTFHRFLPSTTRRSVTSDEANLSGVEDIDAYKAKEVNTYMNDDWELSSNLRISYGGHFSLFNITGRTHNGFSPRVSVRWTPAYGWAVKCGYAHTVQYVHQLTESLISLPTDQWVPIVGEQKPQTADHVSAGVYCALFEGYTISLEGYWKRMHNLLEYRDDYYLMPPGSFWGDKMDVGKGTAKGIDFKITKEIGQVKGQISYSLLWADRQFPNRNGGKKYPARFDNRHKINILADWKINDKWEVSGSWTGMTGNRFTLPTQLWYSPGIFGYEDMLLSTKVNNVRLPFYHRLDLDFKRNTRRGYWNFSIYNVYCNMNTIAVVRQYEIVRKDTEYVSSRPVYKKLKLLPIIPSVSYTWIF